MSSGGCTVATPAIIASMRCCIEASRPDAVSAIVVGHAALIFCAAVTDALARLDGVGWRHFFGGGGYLGLCSVLPADGPAGLGDLLSIYHNNRGAIFPERLDNSHRIPNWERRGNVAFCDGHAEFVSRRVAHHRRSVRNKTSPRSLVLSAITAAAKACTISIPVEWRE